MNGTYPKQLILCMDIICLLIGVPSLSVNDVQLANTSSGLCIATVAVNYHPDQQLLCHSSVVEASYVWYYCYGDSRPAVVANGTASFTLDPTSPLEGVYSCVVPEDGAASVFICMHESKSAA